jgi:voltage-gated potassium channel
MASTAFIVLRRMRAPLIVIITMYAISVLGLTLVPGIDAQGKPTAPMSVFDAFYFISYTATTIGFGELPNAFSYGQRMWATVCIYLTVVGWTYGIVTVLSLLQDRAFQQVRSRTAFARAVRRIGEPFYIVAGYGETGQMLCRALDRLGIAFVVIDRNEDEVNEVDLQDYRRDVPAVAGDVCSPELLLRAGMRLRRCLGVVAVTDDDAANLAVAMSVRLLNPRIPVLARAVNPEIAANMASFGTDHVISPFEKFAEYLALAIRSPGSYQLLDWLTGIPGAALAPPVEPPRGPWVVAGFGRFGSAVVRQLDELGMDLSIIDPEYQIVRPHECVRGLGTEAKTLEEAGIRNAVGLVAATDNDVNNLSIVVTAKGLNPGLFTVLRRNRESNRLLFAAFGADLTMVPSEIIA